MQLPGTVCVCVYVSLYVCLCVRSGPLLHMVQVMILGDFTRFAVITVCVMLPLGAGLSWRFEGGEDFYNMTRAWWTVMLTFVDAGSEQKLRPQLYFTGRYSSVVAL
jgi:hypothetical protein